VLIRTDPEELRQGKSAPRGLGVRFAYQVATNDVEGHMRMEVACTKNGAPLASNTVNLKPNDWFPIELIVRDDEVKVEVPGGGQGASKLGVPLLAGPIILQLPRANTVLEFRKMEIK